MKKIIVGVIIIILIIFGVSYFGKNSKQSDTKESIKIGIATILSGDIAAFGENLVNVAKMQVEEINQKGGLNGRMIELVIEDAKCDSKTGLSAVQKLINVDKVKYIVGGMCSNGILSAAPVVNDNKVVFLTPSTGGKNIDEAGEYIFRIGNSDLLVGRDIASTMAKLGYKKVGVVAESTEYTIDIKNSFTKKADELGLNVAIAEEFQPNTTDFRTVATKIKGENLDAVMVASQTGISGGKFIKQLSNIGAKTQVFSDFLLVFNSDVKKIVGSLDGIYYADPSFGENNSQVGAFFKAYEEKYKIKPLAPYFSAGTYDSINIILDAIKETKKDDSISVHDWILKNVKNYNGFMGSITLDEKGNSNAGFSIKIIKNGVGEIVQ